MAPHALDLDHSAFQLHVERLATFAHQGQDNLAAGLAAHLVHRLHHRQPFGRLAIDLDDQVARLDAGTRGGGVVNRRDHLEKAVFHTDFDTQAAKLAAGAFLQFGKVFRLQVGGVGVEVAEHALDRIFQQGLVIHWLDIGRFDAIHYLGEGAQIIQRQRRLGVFHGRRHRLGGGLQDRAAGQQAKGQGERGEAVEMRHVNSQE